MNSDILPSMILFLNRIQQLLTSWKINFSLAFSLVCISVQLFSQKGVNTLSTNNNQLTTNSNTFAVVVGISNYHDKGIPDLKYAHRDAIAFVDWLKGTGMVKVPEDHIQLLIDSMATRGQLNAALDGILDQAHEGDLVFLYFSGHGDVETKTIAKFGYLLCYDSPPNNYAAGAFSLDYLQAIVSTLANNKIKVIVIADACHAGKLAGSNVLGSRLTSAELTRQYANEIKILSCQPNETSVEGEYWGGGRGVFSYYLTDGLSGFADQNEDRQIKLMELTNYLQTNVSRDVDPHKQIPLVVGDLSENISMVDPEKYLAMVNEKKASKNLSHVDSRGIEEQTLAQLDSATRSNYFEFKIKLNTHTFFCNSNNSPNCADKLYKELLKVEALKPLHTLMRRNYAAALQDEVQKALNALLADDPYEFNDWYLNPEKYAEYPKYLERAIELLGRDHYSFPLLYGQQKYFEAHYLKQMILPNLMEQHSRDSVRNLVKLKLLEAIKSEPNAAYLYHAVANLHWRKDVAYEIDSTVKYCSLAIQLSPTWLTPYHELIETYINCLGDLEKADSVLQQALQIKPESYLLNTLMSWVFQKSYKFQKADSICWLLIKKRPDLFNAWSTMVHTHFLMKDYDKILEYSIKSFHLQPIESNWSRPWYFLSLLRTGREIEAFKFQETNPNKFSQLDFLDNAIYSWYYFDKRDYSKAQIYLNKIFSSRDKTDLSQLANALVLQARIFMHRRSLDTASYFLYKGIETDPTPDEADHTGRICLAQIEFLKGNLAKADSAFKEALKYPKGLKWGMDFGYNAYADFLLNQNQDEVALFYYHKSIDLVPLNCEGPYGIAKYYAKKGNSNEALKWLEMALQRYYPIPEPIYEEPLFYKIKKTNKFKQIMKKHYGTMYSKNN